MLGQTASFVNVAPPPGAITPLPLVVAEYDLLELLGKGGMGAVYKARHRKLKRLAAIKFIHPHLAHEKSLAQRFLREVEAQGQVDHPNIVKAYDAGESSGVFYLAMEFVDGCSGLQLVRTADLPVGTACKIVHDAALGLHHLHEHGILHRDVKPSNLLISSSGETKVSDLGLARCETDDGSLVTAPHSLLGTIDYMAPEALEGEGDIDHRTDIYSLGCTLYYMLSGRPPYHGSSYDTHAKKMRGHLHDKPRSIHLVQSCIDVKLSAIIDRCLAKNPAERYQSMADFAADLEIFCDDRSLTSLVAETQSRLAQAEKCGSTETFAASKTKETLSAGPWLRRSAIAGGVLLAATIGIGLLSLLPRGPQPPIFEKLPAEAVEVGRVYPLLNVEPTAIVFRQDQAAESQVHWQADRKSLSVKAYGLVFIPIAQTDAADFTLRASLHQPTWGAGQVGVFFGWTNKEDHWNECEVLKVAASTQTVRRLVISNNHLELQYRGRELLDSKNVQWSRVGLDQPAPGPVSLEVRVRHGKPLRVTWNGQSLDALVAPTGIPGRRASKTWTGQFGFYADSTSVDFENVEIRIHRLTENAE